MRSLSWRQHVSDAADASCMWLAAQIAAVYEDFDLADRVAYGADPVPPDLARQKSARRAPSVPQSEAEHQIRMLLVLRKHEDFAQA